MDNKLASIITDDTFEVIELALKEPNIFRALSIERKEIRHSNFIGYILDPKQNHGLNDLILKKLLRDIFFESKTRGRDIFDADIIDLSSAEIRREWRNIDLLIIFTLPPFLYSSNSLFFCLSCSIFFSKIFRVF